MPTWATESNGALRLQWSSLDDFLSWLNSTVGPAAAQYGYNIVVEPKPKDEVMVDRV